MSPVSPGPVAAIDCGTNSTRLLISAADGTVLERLMRITRLGEGVDATGKLAPEAIARTVGVLEEYARLMKARGVRRVRLVATSATRDAANPEEFFSAAEAATGLRPERLSGDEEGRLAFAGATSALPERWREHGPLLVVDIGGGSTELVVGPGAAEADLSEGVSAVSLDIGCVRVSERFLCHDPPSDAEIADARTFVRTALTGARRELPPLSPGGPVIGLAGTVSTLASLEARLPVYDRAALHHSTLDREKVVAWFGRLATESHKARLERPGMVAGREDVIAGGALILVEVMDVFDREVCLVSEDDILDGLAAGLR